MPQVVTLVYSLLLQIHHLNGTGESLTIDWVSRHVYWSQREMGVSSVYQLDLNKKTDEYATPHLVLRDPRMVRLVEVDPFSRFAKRVQLPSVAFII